MGLRTKNRKFLVRSPITYCVIRLLLNLIEAGTLFAQPLSIIYFTLKLCLNPIDDLTFVGKFLLIFRHHIILKVARVQIQPNAI